MSKTSRRAVLAGAATLPALAVPALAAGQDPDPIYAAIHAHTEAIAEWLLAIDRRNEIESRLMDQFKAAGRADALKRAHADEEFLTADKAIRDASDRERTAADDLLDVTLTTLPGIIALLRHVEGIASEHSWWFDDNEQETPRSITLVRNVADALEGLGIERERCI
jgi:hypothetical protein